MIGVKVNHAREIADKMRRYAQELNDTSKPNRMVAIELYNFVMKNFQTEGGMTEEGSWEPLAPSTIESKEREGYAMILQNTGALRASFNPFSDWRMAGVGAAQILGGNDDRDPDMAAVHEYGSDRVPARPMLPTQEQANAIGMRVYGFHVEEARRKADL